MTCVSELLTRKGERMEGIKLNVKALAAMMDMSIEELAKLSDINPTHLKDVSANRVKMTARDLINLSKATKVSHENIDIGE